jgi:hypothetical protein
MTLTEAVASGKKFKRVSVGGGYLSYEEFQEEYGLERDDVLATDYEVAPDVSVSISASAFMEAWNTARTGFTSVKPAGTSPFYHALWGALSGSSVE